MQTRCVAIATGLLVGLWSIQAAAYGIVINAREIGPDVVFSYSGSIDVSGMGTPYSEGGSAFAFPWYGSISITSSVTPPFRDTYTFAANGSLVFGTGSFWGADSFTGDSLRVQAYGAGPIFDLSVSGGYAGELLSGSMTFLNKDFAVMGMTPGIYSTDTGGGVVTLKVGAQVPLPATLPLLAGGLAAAGFVMRRRAKA